MSAPEPDRIWWTAEDLALSGLPSLPGTKRGINALAEREGWQNSPKHARKRRGRGGGWEYHWTVLPPSATRALLAKAAEAPARPDRGEAWATFDSLPDGAKTTARERLKAIQHYEQLREAGCTTAIAAKEAATEAGVSARTVFNWLELVEGVAAEDRLAYLIPRHRTAARTTAKTADYRPFMDWLKSQFLQPEEPSFRKCYRDTWKKAVREGWDILKERTARRQLERDVPRVTRVFARQGVTGLEKCFPPQIRDKTTLQAMELVNADCHKFDVFVEWPDGTINRPQVVAFQDVYSGKILSWRIDHSPNKVMVMSAFGELVERWGIPRRVLFDNGREFANKWLTGGTATRFRFQIVEDEPLGVLPLLDIAIHWASPGHGQAKPVERAFRDIATDVAKDPRFAGAYVGNKPDAKPDNYRSRAVPLDTFLSVLDEGLVEHNAREGRLGQTAEGRSFDETFADSYEVAPIRKATEEQRRLWLMGQQVGKLNRDNGQLRVHGNYYHSEWMSEIAGQTVVARFDPEDLHAGIYIYARDGAYLGYAECRQKTGFLDMVEAKAHQRRKARIKRAEKAVLAAHRPHSIDEIAAEMDAAQSAPAEPLVAKVVAPVFRTLRRNLPVTPTPDPALEASRDALILRMQPREAAQPEGWCAPRTPDARWELVQDMEMRSASGKPVGREEARWLNDYRESDEYQARADIERYAAQNDTG